jgi:hypothetical protein
MSQYHFVHRKSHMYWPGIEPGPITRCSHGTTVTNLKKLINTLTIDGLQHFYNSRVTLPAGRLGDARVDRQPVCR